jgi:hypothetical protein
VEFTYIPVEFTVHSCGVYRTFLLSLQNIPVEFTVHSCGVFSTITVEFTEWHTFGFAKKSFIIKRFFCKLMQCIHSGFGSGMDPVPDPDLESGYGLWIRIQEFQRHFLMS